jgi:ABC-type xylose transport system permease subunit
MNASNNIKEVNVSQLQSGVYLLKIDVDFQSVVKRIIIE